MITTYLLRSLLLCLVIVLSSACSTRPLTPVGELPTLPPPKLEDITAARALVEEELGIPREALTTGGPQVAKIRSMVRKLAAAAGFGSVTIPVYVVDAGEDVNAMAVNGGAIVVFRTLIERVPDVDELATVLAHEIAHMAARHHEDEGEADRATGVSILSSVLGSAANIAVSIATGSSAAGDLAGGVTETTSETIGDGAFVKSYSRDMEYEADHVGLMIMTKAGYDPEGAIRFWSRADEIFGEDMSGSSFLSSHPSGPERIQALRDALPMTARYKSPPASSTLRSRR